MKSFLSSKLDLEIVIVDDNSNDDTRKVAHDLAPVYKNRIVYLKEIARKTLQNGPGFCLC